MKKFFNEMDAVLVDMEQWKAAMEIVLQKKFKPHLDPPKNWDSLIAYNYVVRNVEKKEKILDAGSEYYSVILKWLHKSGYRNLTGINIAFDASKNKRINGIKYEFGDVTKTRFLKDEFKAIMALSVIEHNVNWHIFIKEAAYILKRGGILVISFDYSMNRINEKKKMFNMDWNIFCSKDVEEIIEFANKNQLELINKFDKTKDGEIIWNDGLCYTFAVLVFKKIELSEKGDINV